MSTPASRQEFASLVNDARQRHHLSIRAVARIADVPATTAQGWLNGKHFPTPALRGNYLKLLEHLDLVDAVPEDLWDDSWTGVEPALRSGQSPYLGLRPYRVADKDLFFGRSGQSARLADAVLELAAREGTGMIALVGASGSGKSSLLAAGLLGREATGGALAGWGGTALTVIRLLADETPALAGEPGRQLVVVDQLEEALALPEAVRRSFLAALEALSQRAVVVVGMRSDAFEAASLEPLLQEALSRPVLLGALTREECREVIVRPAEALGVAVDEDLVRVLLEELAPGPADRIGAGALPLLSNALLLIWAVGNGRRLTAADYHAAGGIARAVEGWPSRSTSRSSRSRRPRRSGCSCAWCAWPATCWCARPSRCRRWTRPHVRRWRRSSRRGCSPPSTTRCGSATRRCSRTGGAWAAGWPSIATTSW
ncbi:hypothetical protein PROP_01857 [Propionicimonas sp. T2.31MG-18]